MSDLNKSSLIFTLEGPSEIKEKIFIDVVDKNFEECLAFELPDDSRVVESFWGGLQRRTLLDGRSLQNQDSAGKWSFILRRRFGDFKIEHKGLTARLKVVDLFKRRERIYQALVASLFIHALILGVHFAPSILPSKDFPVTGKAINGETATENPDKVAHVTLLDENQLQALLNHPSTSALIFKDPKAKNIKSKIDPKLLEWARANQGLLMDAASRNGTASLAEIKHQMELGKIPKSTGGEMVAESGKKYLSLEDESIARKHFRRLESVYQRYFDEALTREPFFSGRFSYRLEVLDSGQIKILSVNFLDFPSGEALNQFQSKVRGLLAEQKLPEKFKGAILQGEHYFRR